MRWFALFLTFSYLGTTLAAPQKVDPTKPNSDEKSTDGKPKGDGKDAANPDALPKGEGKGATTQDALPKEKLKEPPKLGEDIDFSWGSQAAWGRIGGVVGLSSLFLGGWYLNRKYERELQEQAAREAGKETGAVPGEQVPQEMKPPSSGTPGVTEAGTQTMKRLPPARFRAADYHTVEDLRKALQDFVEVRNPEYEWGYSWIHDCSMLRWQLPETFLSAVQSCADDYSRWVLRFGKEKRMPWPTAEREAERRRVIAEQRGEEKTDDGQKDKPLEFAKVHLNRLRDGMNQAATQAIKQPSKFGFPSPKFAFQPPKLAPKGLRGPIGI